MSIVVFRDIFPISILRYYLFWGAFSGQCKVMQLFFCIRLKIKQGFWNAGNLINNKKKLPEIRAVLISVKKLRFLFPEFDIHNDNGQDNEYNAHPLQEYDFFMKQKEGHKHRNRKLK